MFSVNNLISRTTPYIKFFLIYILCTALKKCLYKEIVNLKYFSFI